MEGKILSIEDAQKLANYDKLLAERDIYKSDYLLLKEKSKKNDKKYMQVIEEKNKMITELKEELYKYKNKQVDIFEV